MITSEDLCKEIQEAVDRGDKCELGETDKERQVRKASLRRK